MAELSALHEKLAEVIGLTQATQRIARRVAKLADETDEPDLVEAMERLDARAREVQRRCQTVAAKRNGLKPSTITAKSRAAKAAAEALGQVPDGAGALDVLGRLAVVVDQGLRHWLALAALHGSDDDPVIGGLVTFAIGIQRETAGDIVGLRSGLCRP
jgi:hypothetical protein